MPKGYDTDYKCCDRSFGEDVGREKTWQVIFRDKGIRVYCRIGL